MNRMSPRALMALALVGASALTQLAVLVSMVSVDVTMPAGNSLGLLVRIQLGTNIVDVGTLILVPLAVLLVSGSRAGEGSVSPEGARFVLTAALATGATLALLVVLRLVADVTGDSYLVGRVVPGDLVYDLALVLLAGASTFWAYVALQESAGAVVDRADGPGPQAASPPSPPSPPPTGFPSGPPTEPPPPSASDPRR